MRVTIATKRKAKSTPTGRARPTGCSERDVMLRIISGLSRDEQSELLTIADLLIESGARIRSNPAGHELHLAMLCNLMGRIATAHPELVEPAEKQ